MVCQNRKKKKSRLSEQAQNDIRCKRRTLRQRNRRKQETAIQSKSDRLQQKLCSNQPDRGDKAFPCLFRRLSREHARDKRQRSCCPSAEQRLLPCQRPPQSSCTLECLKHQKKEKGEETREEKREEARIRRDETTERGGRKKRKETKESEAMQEKERNDRNKKVKKRETDRRRKTCQTRKTQ